MRLPLPLALLPLLGACGAPADDTGPSGPPYGMILEEDGQLYAGAARMVITPDFEVYSDVNGNGFFDGCYNDPAAERGGCDEPFDDANGNGVFDAAWLAGFGDSRAALGVHDDVTVTAVVLSLNGEYVAIAGIDALGVLENRIRDARDLLEADGFDRDHVVVSSSHSHQMPDTVGMWGQMLNLVSGIHTDYIESIAPSIRDAVQTAASSMVAVSPTVGVAEMAQDPTLTGVAFGGVNPDDRTVGGINDIRDPILPADQVLAVALDGADGRVATLVDSSGHPETFGDENTKITADYVFYTREWIEASDGGLTVFLSGALGGMQSALGATLPALDEQGGRVVDGGGTPSWDESGSGETFAREYGTLVGQAAQAALTDTQAWEQLSVRTQSVLIPVANEDFKLAFNLGMLDTPDDYVVQDSSCPGWDGSTAVFGCVPTGVWEIRLGPVTLATFPGELLPELFWGVPDEPAMQDATLRASRDQDGVETRERRWPNADPDCATVPYEDCVDVADVGDCDCLQHHAAPYVISDGGAPPIQELLPGTYKAPVGITNGYCGYIVPRPDFSTYASQLTEDGDHYEETNSCTVDFAVILQDAWLALSDG